MHVATIERMSRVRSAPSSSQVNNQLYPLHEAAVFRG